MNPADVPAWLQAGGLLAFAGAVWMELRALRGIIQKQGENIAALLERDRDRNRTVTPPTGVPIIKPVIGE